MLIFISRLTIRRYRAIVCVCHNVVKCAINYKALNDVKLIIICLLEPRAEPYVANDTGLAALQCCYSILLILSLEVGSRVTASDWLACQVSTWSPVTLLADSVPADSHSQHGVANNKIVLLRLPLLYPLKRDITAARLLPTIFIWWAKKFTSYIRNGIQMRLLLRRHCSRCAA